MAESEDRTHGASEKRLHQAREDGRVPLSRELISATGLAASALVLILGAPSITWHLGQTLRDMLVDLGGNPGLAISRAQTAFIMGASPMLVAIVLAGSAAVLLQTGFLVHTKALVPDPSRLDPRRGLKRVFGMDNAVEALKAVAKLAVLGWAVWTGFAAIMPVSPRALLWTPAMLVTQFGHALVQLVLLVLAAQAGIAVLDVAWMRWRFSQRMRMSREELRQEQKESDGDPKIKARLRQLRQARARRRMLASISKATVVVTNPTHYAVALAYERGKQAAPRVVAKGMDEVAARIREAAEKAGVPLVANPPLARALYTVALDAEVPSEHFRAVAEIIAYVWRLKNIAGAR